MYQRKERAAALVESFLQSGQKIPFSPAIGTKLVSFANKPVAQVEVDQLVRLLETDAGFASRLLQLANSSYFSGVEKIVSLRRAIIQVGLEEAISFTQMVYYRNVLPEIPQRRGFWSDQEYWQYSWSTAVAGKSLAHPKCGSNVLPGDLYIAGLLHGVGRVVLAFNSSADIGQKLQQAEDADRSFEEVQLELFGTTDADISRELLVRWQMPETVCRAVGSIYHPESADSDIQEFAGLLQLASCIARMSQAGADAAEGYNEPGQTWVATSSSLPLADPVFLGEQVEEICRMLQSRNDLFADEAAARELPADSPSGEHIPSGKKKKSWQRIIHRLTSWL